MNSRFFRIFATVSGNVALLALLVLPLLTGGCEVKVTKTAVPAPVPSAEDRRIAQGALALSDVLLMARSGYKEANVIAEVKRRRLDQALDPISENKLVDFGASKTLIESLKAKENILTDLQKIAYAEQKSERDSKVHQGQVHRAQVAIAKENEQQDEIARRQFYQTQTLNNIRQKEQAQAQYEFAERNYKAQREGLEQQIQYLENHLNRARSRGAGENDLRADNQTLENYRTQLKNLTPPMRPI